MIGYLKGVILYSNEQEVLLMTASGIGYQVFYSKVLPEGKECELFIKHIKKETSDDLYGFSKFGEKRIFELLISVKGIGPKSAYALSSKLGLNGLVNAISLKDKKSLTSVSGIGPKAGAQILLDLTDKVQKLRSELLFGECETGTIKEKQAQKIPGGDNMRLPLLFSERENLGEVSLLNDAIEACEELGFSKIDVIPIAQRVMKNNSVQGVEGLVRLVLKEF